MEKVEHRHRSLSVATLEAVKVLGLKQFAENPSISVSAIESEHAEDIRRELLKHGIRVAGGQDKLKGRIFRISHMGVAPKDGLMLIGMLEVALKKLGIHHQLGEGISVYSKTLLERRIW